MHAHPFLLRTCTRRVNKVGPYNNPQETYNYYYLPFCKQFEDGKAEHAWGGLGEVLQGNELIDSKIVIQFGANVRNKTVCSQEATVDSTRKFAYAVEMQYW